MPRKTPSCQESVAGMRLELLQQEGQPVSVPAPINWLMQVLTPFHRVFVQICFWVGGAKDTAPILTAACGIIGGMVLVIAVIHFLVSSSWRVQLVGLAIIAHGLYHMFALWWWDWDAQHVRTKQVWFSVSEEGREKITRQQEYWARGMYGVENLAMIKAVSDHAARTGQKDYFSRASASARSTRVIADPSRLGERFWALDNYLLARTLAHGYTQVAVTIVPLSSVNNQLAQDVHRWQHLRSRVAQLPKGADRNDIRRKMINTTMRFMYSNDLDMDFSSFKVEFGRIPCPRAARVGQSVKAKTFKPNWRTIDDLEAELLPLIKAAAARPRRHDRNGGVAPKNEEDTPVMRSPSNQIDLEVLDDNDDNDDEGEGLCVYCLEQSAEMVMQLCGHLVFCASCRKQVVGHTMQMSSLRFLDKVQLKKTKVPCPICRRSSCVVRRQEFKKTVYKP